MFSAHKSNFQDYILIHTGVLMIPHSFNGMPNQSGVLYLTKNGKLELNFAVNPEEGPTWKCILDQFDQLRRMTANILRVETYGIVTLFKFSDPSQARSLYEVVEVLQADVKVVYKNEICAQIDFELFEMKTYKENGEDLKENRSPVEVPAVPGLIKIKKSKVKRQSSLKNSFKTIVNAAKRMKEIPKIAKIPSTEEEETSPLLI
ncbi:uncharacterized protein LOC134831480 [Culicoides brevitarsis]|uniref:uncharacterized protein LOC134831480 n=1 Tax=Culicoides brevitarsis TaxID=469753 RepID=UPI00307B9958